MKDYNKIAFACWLSFATIFVQGQELNFKSPVFENAVRQHLNLEAEDVIGFSQLDTITFLDLSRRGLTDIQDILLLPNLRILDLRDNALDDLHPITLLDSLEYVDLSYNNLKSVNDLFGSRASNLTVNVAYNCITDFTFFSSVSSCDYTFDGTSLQLIEDAPYFDVCNLCADVDADGVPVLNYRGYTNMEDAAFVECGSERNSAVMDGDTYTVTLSRITETTKAYLGNGVIGDTTYVVPPANLEVDPGQSIIFETGLPEGYSIRGFSPAQQGTMQIDGTKLTYTASDDFESEEFMFAYYEGAVLRGFSKVSFQPEVFIPGDVNGDKKVLIGDVIAILNYILGDRPGNFKVKAADVNSDGLIVIGDVIAVLNIIVGQ
jgi:hypothetical protein